MFFNHLCDLLLFMILAFCLVEQLIVVVFCSANSGSGCCEQYSNTVVDISLYITTSSNRISYHGSFCIRHFRTFIRFPGQPSYMFCIKLCFICCFNFKVHYRKCCLCSVSLQILQWRAK